MARVGQDRLQHGPDLVRAAFEEVGMEASQPTLGPAVRGPG
jgi:hypothetical protein